MQRRLSLKGGGKFLRYLELAHQKSKSVKTRLVLFTVTLLLSSFPAQANYPSNSLPYNTFNVSDRDPANDYSPKVKAEAPNRYVVKQGDTLWDISGRYLNNPWQWRDLWASNKQLKNPHLIYPGDILLLCVIQGSKRVGVDEGEGCSGIERDMVASNIPIDLSTHPKSQRVTITALDNSIPAIPLSAIESWLSRVSIVDPNDFYNTPYIIATKQGTLMSAQGDKVYAKGAPLIVGQDYGVYRAGKPYIEADSQKNLGLEVTQVAKGKVLSVAENGISSIPLSKSYAYEVRQGDRVFIEQYQGLKPIFHPKPAQINYAGQIVRILDGISKAGKHSVVTVNLGQNHGATIGDVFGIYQQGELEPESSNPINLSVSGQPVFKQPVFKQPIIKQNETIFKNKNTSDFVRLPSESVGYLMLFRTFDKVSYAYVLEADQPLEVGDGVFSPLK